MLFYSCKSSLSRIYPPLKTLKKVKPNLICCLLADFLALWQSLISYNILKITFHLAIIQLQELQAKSLRNFTDQNFVSPSHFLAARHDAHFLMHEQLMRFEDNNLYGKIWLVDFPSFCISNFLQYTLSYVPYRDNLATSIAILKLGVSFAKNSSECNHKFCDLHSWSIFIALRQNYNSYCSDRVATLQVVFDTAELACEKLAMSTLYIKII